MAPCRLSCTLQECSHDGEGVSRGHAEPGASSRAMDNADRRCRSRRPHRSSREPYCRRRARRLLLAHPRRRVANRLVGRGLGIVVKVPVRQLCAREAALEPSARHILQSSPPQALKRCGSRGERLRHDLGRALGGHRDGERVPRARTGCLLRACHRSLCRSGCAAWSVRQFHTPESSQRQHPGPHAPRGMAHRRPPAIHSTIGGLLDRSPFVGLRRQRRCLRVPFHRDLRIAAERNDVRLQSVDIHRRPTGR